MISDMTNNTKKMTKIIFAIPAAAPAIPVKPSAAATIAITIKAKTQVNIDMIVLLI